MFLLLLSFPLLNGHFHIMCHTCATDTLCMGFKVFFFSSLIILVHVEVEAV